jgi:hypothetical protein
LLSLVQFVIVGVMLRKILNPTCERQLPPSCTVCVRTLAIISAVSLKFEHLRMVFDFAR